VAELSASAWLLTAVRKSIKIKVQRKTCRMTTLVVRPHPADQGRCALRLTVLNDENG
jgi:hypothetical protein